MNPTLLVLAAGMGSRYGGLKQMDPMGPAGEALLDYSVHDAMRCGIERVVFVIRRDFEEIFREKVGGRFEDRIDVSYAFQQLNELPAGFSVPEGRQKPWGTGHAIWCARETIDGPFIAINADDFYGAEAYRVVADYLRKPARADASDFCMAGYGLKNTLSEFGTVSRGLCSVSPEGTLTTVRELTKIGRSAGGIANLEDDGSFTPLAGEEFVSMNFWGFTPVVFGLLEQLLVDFLEARGGELKSEFYIPEAVGAMIREGKATESVLPVASRWFGVTYPEDKPGVAQALKELGESGEYPVPLWR